MKRYPWHSWLNMPKEDISWYKADLKDEVEELNTATDLVGRWSEKSDVVYTVMRARWNGYQIDSPLSFIDRALGTMYMYPKYSLRYLFFQRAGKKVDPQSDIRDVRNPKKVKKLKLIAKEYSLPESEFTNVCQKQLRCWRFILPK